MNHIILKSHTDDCGAVNKELNFRSWTISNLLLYHDNEFILLEYCKCIQGWLSDCEFTETLLRGKFKRMETIESWEVSRSWTCDKSLRKMIREGRLFTDIRHECNYTYCDNAGKEYAVVSEIRFIDRLLEGNNIIESNYNEAKKYLIDNEKDYLLYRLDKLYDMNKSSEIPNTAYTCDTIKEMRTQLNKLIKTKKP